MDVLRVLCCIFVMAIHITPMGVSDSGKMASIIIQGLVRVGLPIFFVISGMYLLNKRVDSLASFYKKRIPFLIIPFLVYSFIHFMTHYIQLGVTDAKMLWGGYLTGLTAPTGISVHFWFIYSLLGLYIIAPLLSYFIAGIDSKKAMLIIVAVLLVRGYSQYLKQYIPFLDIPDFPVWMLYFLLGGLVYKLPAVDRKVSGTIAIAAYIVTCVLSYYQSSGAIQTNMALYDGGVNMYVFTLALCIYFKDIKVHLSERSGRILTSVSENTYGAFLIHVLILNELNRFFDLSWQNEQVTVFSFIITPLVFSISLLCAYFINKAIVNPLLYGANKSLSMLKA